MEFYAFLGFVGILRESHKIFFKNARLMASITILILILHSLLLLSNIFSIKPLVKDLFINVTFLQLTTPGTSEFAKLLMAMKEDLRIFVGVEWIFILATSIASLFSATATIVASGLTYGGEQISIKDLLIRVVKSFKRPFVSWFYITLFELGFIFFIWAILFSLKLIFENQFASSAISWAIWFLAGVFYSNLAIVWTLALVVSVLEERSGIDALGKAGQLVKGLKLTGFFINLVFGLLSSVVFQGLRLINFKQSEAIKLVIALLVFNFLCLVKMFTLMVFTVFYYECKKSHGEETFELKWSSEYTKLPTTAVVSADIP